MSLLEINSVEYKYPQSSKKALDNVSLCVERGEYIAVLGSNGSGKSTMARLMAGFFNQSSLPISQSSQRQRQVFRRKSTA